MGVDIRDFLPRLKVEHGPNASGEYMCRCPAHDDRAASLCVKDGEKGIVLKCQAGCDTHSVVTAMGLTMKDLFRTAPAPRGSRQPAASTGKPGTKNRGKFVCAYPYRDEKGTLLFEACRYQREDGSKTFLLRQPDPASAGGYRYTKAGVRMVLYRLPEVVSAIRNGKPVIVCEGEKDCDNLANLGFVATTNPMGAGKWGAGNYTQSLTGGKIYVIPDNDDVGRDHAKTVCKAALTVTQDVYLVDLAAACPQLPPKGDATDFLQMKGTEGKKALEDLLDKAQPYQPDPASQLEEAADQYGKVFGYCVDNGRICQNTTEGAKPLANFVAIPRGVITRDDGVNISKEMIIDGWSLEGHPLPQVHIKAAQFNAMNWVAENWDFAASIMPGNTVKDKLRYVISEVGRMTARRTTEYTHTGWRKIGGKWAYLYQGGAIGVDDVSVDLGSGLSAYRLDGGGAEVFEDLSYRQGADATYSLLGVMAEHVAIPLLGTLFLAPLREFLAATGVAPAYALFLLGGTGTRKSTALALGLSHFGNFTGKSLPASFNDTANFIRKKAFLLKDAPIVVDDYHPVTSLQERKKMEATAQSLARAFGDGAERGRMKSDLTLQEAMPPRGVAIISGEDTPGVGESGMARFYVVNVGKDDVPAGEALTAMQEMARQGYLQKSMYGYIKWLLKQVDDMPGKLHEGFIRNRSVALERTKGQHGRTAEAIAHMMLGYESMLRYMRDVGVLDNSTCIRELERAWTVATQNSDRQAEESREDRPSKIFLSSISELLTSKAARVYDLFGQGSTGGNGDMIGYVDGANYYLIPGLAYRAVARMCNDQGTAFPLTSKMLYKQMREDGILTPENTTSTSATRPKWIEGRAQRLLWIPKRYIDGPGVYAEQQEMDLTNQGDDDGQDVPF